jgi:two-component system, chemotaxis family, sensor kinase CheA
MSYSPELHQKIEDLALRLVVGHPDGGDRTSEAVLWTAELRSIQAAAEREYAGPVARAAAALAAILEAPESADSGVAERLSAELQEGFARLQQSLAAEPVDARSERMPAEDPELLADFVLESREHVAAIESQVLILEHDPSNSESLHSVFRGFHTIKGLAGFLELGEVQELSHEVEAVLDRARNGQFTITPAAIDVILQGADYLRRWLSHIEAGLSGQPSEAPPRDAPLLARIRALLNEVGGERAGGEDIVALAKAVELAEAAPAESAAVSGLPAARRSEAMAVKVDTGKLDFLVDMAGELVIAESLVRHDGDLTAVKSPGLQRKMAQLTRITAELHKTAMAMRLVPVGPLFRRMARLVRDLSRQFGKQVRMDTQGDEIELDRTIVEELADPLMHMVRNALDHGVENSEERVRAGKPPSACVSLKAYHQSGQVVIEIADDGKGLDRDRILAKAMERGLVASGEGRADADVWNLIFEPGFSTASQVTNVSGRGVGMDVVRRHIEKLRGRIEIRSAAGVGTSFLLKLPLTLAIIDGLVVAVGQERYIVPLFGVRELFRPAQDSIWTVQQRAEMALVRGALLPVLRLYRRFGVEPRSTDPTQGVLVVAEVEGQRFCLLVDELIGKQEVVIKALGETFRSVTGVAGGAILGDGRVGLILDLERLFKGRED